MKTKKFKRIFAFLLVLTLITAMLPLNNALAVVQAGYWTDYAANSFNGGDGSEENPYQIATADQLAYMANWLNGLGYLYDDYYYILTTNIDMDGHYWEPIQYFKGVFDGQGHVVTGIDMSNMSTDMYIGFFGRTAKGAVVANLGVDVDIIAGDTPDNNIGFVAGLVADNCGTIINCFSSGSVNANVTYLTRTGGLVGDSNDYYSKILNSYSTADVVGGGGYCDTGGLVAHANHYVINCYATGNVTEHNGTNNLLGGLIAYFYEGTVENCHWNDSIASGFVKNEDAKSVCTSPLSLSVMKGGVASIEYVNGKGETAVAENFVDALNGGAGRIPSSYVPSGLALKYWMEDKANTNGGYPVISYNQMQLAKPTGLTWGGSGTVACWNSVPKASGYQVKLIKNGAMIVKNINTTSTSYNFVESINEAGGYLFIVTALGDGTIYLNSKEAYMYDYYYAPVLSNVTSVISVGNSTISATMNKEGTLYIVPTGSYTNKADLDAISSKVTASCTASVVQALSIAGLAAGNYQVYGVDTGGILSTPSPIIIKSGSGTQSDPYVINTPKELRGIDNNPNAFYELGNDIDMSDYGQWAPIKYFAGGLNGNGYKITGLTVGTNEAPNSWAEAGLFTSINTGGLVTNLGVNITIVSSADMANVGGIAGSNRGTIINCYSTGEIKVNAQQLFAGGLVGKNLGKILNSFATNNIAASGNGSIGGLAGYGYMGSIINCYATGNASNENSGTFVGGLLGTADSINSVNCYWSSSSILKVNNIEVKQGIGSGSVPNITKLSSNVMKGEEGSILYNDGTSNKNTVKFLNALNRGRSAISDIPSGVTLMYWGADSITAPQNFNYPVLTTTIMPTNIAPLAKNPVPTQNIPAGSNVSFSAADIADDTDGDALTIINIVTAPSAIATASLKSGKITVSRLAEGSTSMVVTVSDGNGGTVDVTVPIFAPINHKPTAKSTMPTQSMIEYNYTNFSAADIAEDEDGDTLTITGIVTAPDSATALAYLYGGSVTIEGIAAGSTFLVVTVSDGKGEMVNVTVPIEVTFVAPSNHAPTVKATVPTQSMTVGSNASFNASDIAEDEDSDTLTVTNIVTTPNSTYATASLNNGTVTITGVATGSASIVVTVSDGKAGTVNVTVPIKITAAADVEISITQSPIKTILHAITFGLFFDDTIDVSIRCADIVDHYEYQTVADGDTFDENGTWTQDDSFNIAPDFKGRVYARALYSNGTTSTYTVKALVVDKTKPTISASYDASSGFIEVSITDRGAGIEKITYQIGSDAEQTINLELTETQDITTQHNFTINSLPDGNYNVVINARDNSGNAAATETVPVDRGGTAPIINTNSLDDGVVGTSYSNTITATGDAPITWSIDSGNLPDGLTLDPDTGDISGTPTEEGSFSFSVTATNSEGDDTKALSIDIDPATPTSTAPIINTNSLDDGVVGTSYSQMLVATGSAITWSVYSGDLPNGLELNANTGRISGTPATSGVFNFTVKAENSDGDDTKALSIEISTATPSGTAPVITTNFLSGGTVGSPYSQALAATGDTPITWSIIGSLPNGLTLNGSTISGTPTTSGTSNITVKAINSAGDDTKTLSIYISSASSGNDGNNGGGSSGSSSSTTPTIVLDKKPDQLVIAASPLTPTVGQSGKATVTVPLQTVVDTINKAIAEAARQGRSANGIGVSLETQNLAGTKSIGIVLTLSTLKMLVDSKVQQLDVNGGLASFSFDMEALEEIQKQSTGDVTVTLAPATGLCDEAKTLIGIRPVYNITLSYVKDGKTVNITSLNKGSVTLSIPYSPGKNEAVGYLFGIYVDGNGKATRIDGSTYDANSKSVIFDSNHFSVYGVGYTAPSAKITDISTHWAKESIDYVVGRGLLARTSDTTFSPDTAMSRGMLVTALGRLSGADVSGYKTSSFTDVKADSSFLPYIEWAYKKGIISGIGNSQFVPDRAVTREEISVILQNYAKATGYTLPITREAVTFADSSSMSSSFKDAVKAMQQAGIMSGKNNGYFDPKGSATRAEAATMLHQYIKLTIDPATAQGWALKDDGQRMYYRDGKALTGWQTIDDKVYCFDSKGGAYTNGWKQNDKGDWYYFGNDGVALVGWWDIGSDTYKKRYYFTKDAIMVSGEWLEIDGKWYYFYVDGILAVSTTIDSYKVDENGVRKIK